MLFLRSARQILFGDGGGRGSGHGAAVAAAVAVSRGGPGGREPPPAISLIGN